MKARLASIADLEALVALNAHVQKIHATAHPGLFKDEPDPAQIRAAFAAMLERPEALWALAENAKPVGYVFAELRDRLDGWSRRAIKVCSINQIVVAPSARRSGLGRSLVKFVVSAAEDRGYNRIEIDVWSFNMEAKRCFAALGFEVFNERMVLRSTVK